MAFDPIEIKIVPKGLNLVAPGDQVAEGDCLDLTGWWPGSAGRLQQQRGDLLKNQGGSGNLNSIEESDGLIFFGDVTGNLYWGAQDGSAGTLIGTGYDGNPLGMCAYQHILWVMNRNNRMRYATGPYLSGGAPVASNWGVASAWPASGSPPVPTPLTGQLSGGGGLADGDHSWWVTFVDQYGYESDPSPALILASSSGPATRSVNLAGGGTTVSLNAGQGALSMNFGAWANGCQLLVTGEGYPDWPALQPYTLTYVNTSTLTMSPAWAGATGTFTVEIYYPPNNGKCTIQRPGVVPAPAGWNIYHQSPGTDGPYQVNLNGPLVYTGTPTDPNQLAPNLYIDYGDAGHGQDDQTIMSADLLLEMDHDPPPAAMVLANKTYNGRLVAANTADHPNRLYYTNPNQPSYFPGSNNSQVGNWVDIGDDTSDEILHVSVKVGYLLIYRQRSIWRCMGDLGDASSVIGPLIPNMGIAGPNCVVGTSNGDIAVVRQGIQLGIYRVTDWEQRISGKVETIFNGMGSECFLPISVANNNQAVYSCALGYALGRLWFSYPEGTPVNATYPTRTLICDVEQDQFSFSVAGRWFATKDQVFGAYLHGTLFFLGAGPDGSVVSIEDGPGPVVALPGFVAAAPNLAYQSGYVDGGKPDHEKTWGDLVITHQTCGASLNVEALLNKGTLALPLGTIQSTLPFPGANPATSTVRQIIPLVQAGNLPIESFNLAVRISGQGPSTFPGAIIDSPIILHAMLKPRRAATWDSGPTDHGAPGAKVIDTVEVDIDAPAGFTLTIQSDIPGGILTQQTTLSNGLTNGRQTIRMVLAGGSVLGRVLRYQIYASGSPPSPFLLYGVRLRVLALPVFVDGSMGDLFLTAPILA